MLRGLRRWATRTVSDPQPTPADAQRTAALARHDRADTIAELRGAVRRLQQEIKDASDELEGCPEGEMRTGREERLAAIERRLDQAQRELARYQARV